MKYFRPIASILAGLLSSQISLLAAPGSPELQKQFTATVRPFIDAYCVSCHNPEKKKGDLDLSPYQTTEAVVKDFRQWETVMQRLKDGEMPPEKAKVHPTKETSRKIVDWIQTLRAAEAKRTAGDPGLVLARRLSNAEYNNTIRDLTGYDIRPTREFPVDPANVAGFDNSGESLTMSPGLLKKYLEAAREVANHMVLLSDGITFAPHEVVADTDRDKFCVNRILDFYKRQGTDYADYFEAAWRYKNRAALGRPRAMLNDLASEAKLSPKYLTTVWLVLSGPREEAGPIAALQKLWSELPEPRKQQTNGARAGCVQMRDFVADLRQLVEPKVVNLRAPQVSEGSQFLVLEKNRRMSGNRRRFGALPKTLEWETVTASYALPELSKAQSPEKIEASYKRFCDAFPDHFYISERARIYHDPKEEQGLTGRYLSAGFHNVMGYYRDDGPLCDMVLDDTAKRELDRLWLELDTVASACIRMHTGFIWYERAESGYMQTPEFYFARAEDKDSISEEKIKHLSEVYIAKSKRLGASPEVLEVMRQHFEWVNANIRNVEAVRLAAEPSHLKALVAFAEKAVRRPFTAEEQKELLAFYQSLRASDGLSHEEAMRDSLVSVLMSPHFCYRVDLVEKGPGVKPLSDYALANRLSYFLWSSMPDAALLARAKAGDLHKPEVLMSEARRMMRDEKIRGFALEFGGNWLDMRRFEEHNSVNRQRFPMFDNTLRAAMFEEPVYFLTSVVRDNRSILDFLYADYTFVNQPLAKFYGIPTGPLRSNEWVQVSKLQSYQRGGLLPMAVFLTKNAPGDRTSPVKRGNWVIKNLLGEHVPAPPAVVPELVSDEAKMGELTLRQMLAKHREDKSCSVCHERFDAIGLAFEGFGPVGEVRTKDFAGHEVDTHATFPGGSEGVGLPGLRKYIKTNRQKDFVDNLSRKLLSYALGRSLILSDDALVSDLESKLAKRDYRFNTLVETIVTSPQFLTKRGAGSVAQN